MPTVGAGTIGPFAKSIQGTNEELEGLCPLGAFWRQPCIGVGGYLSKHVVLVTREGVGMKNTLKHTIITSW